jgi:peptidoglycan hydrolase-like protein with peptidoglycan-binding domain
MDPINESSQLVGESVKNLSLHTIIFWIPLVLLVVAACSATSTNRVEPTGVSAMPGVTITQEPSSTPGKDVNMAADLKELTLIETLPPATQAPTNEPTITFTISASEPTQISIMETATTVPIPELNRTLSFQSPFMEGEDVLALQEQLHFLGYTEVGTPDGVFGRMTDAAVRKFQTDQGLVVDGIVGQQTWQSLFQSNSQATGQPEQGDSFSYYLGAKDIEIKDLKERLFELGYPICDSTRDFGAQTDYAVRLFQAVNALEIDGVVGPKTWDVLFSENALPAPQPEAQRSFSTPIEIGGSNDLVYDGKNIWVTRNDFGAENDALSKLDHLTGTGIARIQIDELEGGARHLHPTLVHQVEDFLWVAGRSSSGTETGTPTIVAIKTSGKLLGEPIYVGTYNIEVSNVVDFFSAGNKVWAVVNEPFIVLYELSSSTLKSVRRLEIYDLYEATGAAFDGTRLWIAANKDHSFGVWEVNLENGIVSGVLGICGAELAFDGRWVWVSQTDQVVAIDSETGQVMASAPIKGFLRAMTSNEKNQIWALTSYNADTFLQALKTR